MFRLLITVSVVVALYANLLIVHNQCIRPKAPTDYSGHYAVHGSQNGKKYEAACMIKKTADQSYWFSIITDEGLAHTGPARIVDGYLVAAWRPIGEAAVGLSIYSRKDNDLIGYWTDGVKCHNEKLTFIRHLGAK